MDNRHALIVDCKVTRAVGTGERDAAKAMAADRPGVHQKTLVADKNYDTKVFVAEMPSIGVTPHVAQNTARTGGSATVTARKDDAPAAVQAAIVTVAGLGSCSVGGGLIQTTSG